jgi:muconate cycloisomerase
LGIPLRKPFTHAAHTRDTADPLIFELELANGITGFGETLPRPYVSGESIESVTSTIENTFIEQLLEFRPDRFTAALEQIVALPDHDARGRVITAARAGVELALLDAYSKCFERPISEAVGWLGFPGFGAPGSSHQIAYSGIVASRTPQGVARAIRRMRWFGLRDFKLKVGFPDDSDRIAAAVGALGRDLGAATRLRLDANGAWSLDEAAERLTAWQHIPIECIEQPLAEPTLENFQALKDAVPVTLLHDESLVTFDDAERLLGCGVGDAFNIRVSKNGGFLHALRLAQHARRGGAQYQLGCMVGETSILSAVGRHFLENVPGVWFAEGSYGRFLLRGDIARPTVRLHYKGRIKPMSGLGWGVYPSPALLDRFRIDRPIEFRL